MAGVVNLLIAVALAVSPVPPLCVERGCDMSLNATQARKLIDQVLIYLAPEIPYSLSARELLVLTACAETNLGEYIYQIDGGPARGIFQMEASTEKDIYENFLCYNSHIYQKIENLRSLSCDDLAANLCYQIAMARIHYWRVPEPLPDHDDVSGLAQYWKRHYNTYKGKGNVNHAIEKYFRYAHDR
jgi:hypothetical protein